MNLVRLGLIVTLGLVAYYALTLYAVAPNVAPTVTHVDATCTWGGGWGGVGALIVACFAIGGAVVVAAVDLARRVY